MQERIVCIVGPTACKKTAYSIALAKRFHAEIVSADSVCIYRGMDIGSAKPSASERQQIPHHMLDCAEINDSVFSVERYKKEASRCIEMITARGNMPMVVGGTGLYIHSLTYPLNFAVPSDPNVRSALSLAYDEAPMALYARLQSIDAASASIIHPNNKKRVVRALEVFTCSGKPLSSFGADFVNAAGHSAPFRPVMIGLTMERNALYQRIDRRVDEMLAQGLEDEARRIYACGYNRTLPAMQAIRYRQLFACFDGECSHEEAIEAIKRETRRFSKRQMTWFKRDGRISWFNVSPSENVNADAETLEAIAREIELKWNEDT